MSDIKQYSMKMWMPTDGDPKGKQVLTEAIETRLVQALIDKAVIEELHQVGNCAVDCGSTEVMDYVDFRLSELKGKL